MNPKRIAFKIDKTKTPPEVSLADAVDGADAKNVTLHQNDYVHWFVPVDSGIIAASVSFKGQSPFYSGGPNFDWDTESPCVPQHPECVMSSAKPFPYTYCVTVLLTPGHFRDQVSIAGEGVLRIV